MARCHGCPEFRATVRVSLVMAAMAGDGSTGDDRWPLAR